MATPPYVSLSTLGKDGPTWVNCSLAQFLVSQGAQAGLLNRHPKFVAYEPTSRQKRGRYDWGAEEPKAVAVLRCFFPLLRTRSESANKNQKRMGGWIMKAKSLLLTVLIPVSGLTFLSSPASAECWMTCPPGSTATPSATGTQSATATAEPVASPEELTSAKKPKTTAKASPAPAKPKASPVPAGTTAEPVASPEELTPAKQTETTAKASPAPTPATSKAAPTPAGTGLPPESPQVQSTTPAPAPAPTQEAVAVPQPSEDNAAFQPAPTQGAAPAPVPIPGPVPGTATMDVIPE